MNANFVLGGHNEAVTRGEVFAIPEGKYQMPYDMLFISMMVSASILTASPRSSFLMEIPCTLLAASLALIGYRALRWAYLSLSAAELRWATTLEQRIGNCERLGAQLNPLKADLDLHSMAAQELKAADKKLCQCSPDDSEEARALREAEVTAAEEAVLQVQARIAPLAQRYTQYQKEIGGVSCRLDELQYNTITWSARRVVYRMAQRVRTLKPILVPFPDWQNEELQVPPGMAVAARVAAREDARERSRRRRMDYEDSYNSSNSF